MKKTIIGDFLIKNSELVYVKNFEQPALDECKVVYEVIRVIQKSPLFLDLHLDRLIKSVELINEVIPDLELIKESIYKIIENNKILDNNIKLSLCYRKVRNLKPDFYIYLIPSKYPTLDEIKKGVNVKTISANRVNPNAKIENIDFRSLIDKIIMEYGCYEVLLVNEVDIVTEGSRSNIFFIKGEVVYTPPLSLVLGGITRYVISNICEKLTIPVVETVIKKSDLDDFECAFLTGTSPGVLPICKIDDIYYKVYHPLLNKIIKEYNFEVLRDIHK